MIDIIQKTKMGIPLDDMEYKKLLIALGLKKSLTRILFLITLLLVAIFIIIFQIYSGQYILAFATVIVYPIFHLISIKSFIDPSANLQNYLEAIDIFYNEKFGDYLGYYIFRTPNVIIPEEGSLNPDALFLSNGYQFLIFADFLKSTEFELRDSILSKGGRHVLKVLNQETVNNIPLVIRPEDISNYFEVVQTRSSIKTDFSYKNHTLKFPVSEYKNYVEILLIDNSVLRLGRNILDLLRIYIPAKEVRRPM